MTPAELRAGGMLAGDALAGLASRIEQVQQAIGGRVFAATGPAGAPVRLVYDSVAQAVYQAIGTAGRMAGLACGETAALVATDNQPVSRVPGGSLALAALNALAGDRLGPHLAPLAIPMAVRAANRDVGLTAQAVDGAFPDATAKLAVFVHGLAETDTSWRRNAEKCTPYGDRLQTEFGYTPVYLRYNTGLHVSENGRDLADLLEALARAWPRPVQEILLVGHSMGGLVIRSACHYGRERGCAWVDAIRHVLYLGSPHLGAPLARAAGIAGWALGRLPETRPFVPLVSGPSSVKDLRYGYVLDDDWAGCEPDCCLRDHRGDVPLLAGANHYAFSATVTANPADPIGAIVGDLLVQPASAHGRRRARQHIPFPIQLGRRLSGMHHFDLLNHHDVWTAIRSQLR